MFLMLFGLSFSSFGQNKIIYEDSDVKITTNHIECKGFLYASFSFSNKTDSSLVICYDIERLFSYETGYSIDKEQDMYTLQIDANSTFIADCNTRDFILFLGKRSHKIHVIDYRLINLQKN